MSRKIAAPLPTRPFTARENEICALLAQGFSSKEIASHLCLSRKTVDAHRYTIGLKMSHAAGRKISVKNKLRFSSKIRE